MQAAAGTMSSILADVSTIFNSIVEWCSSVIEIITSNPLLLIFVLISLAFLGVVMVRKLMRL